MDQQVGRREAQLLAQLVRLRLLVRQPRALPPQPLPRELELLGPQRRQHRRQEVQDRRGVDLEVRRDEALAAQPFDDLIGLALQRQFRQAPHLHRHPAGHPRGRAEVVDDQAAVVAQREVPRVRVGVQQPGALRRREVQRRQQLPRPVAHLGRALGDHLRQRRPADPLGHEHLGTGVDDLGDEDLPVVAVGVGELALRGRLQLVVELLQQPLAQLDGELLDVEVRLQHFEQRRDPRQLAQVRAQRVARAGVLDLDGHLAPVVPHRPVHLADARRRGRGVVEGREPLAPLGPDLPLEHPVDAGGRQRRRRVLELRQRLPVGGGQVLGERRLEDRQRLAQLHRAALELPEHAEQVFGGPSLRLLAEDLVRQARDPLAETDGRASGQAQRQGGELHAAGEGPPRKVVARMGVSMPVAHVPHALTPRPYFAPHAGEARIRGYPARVKRRGETYNCEICGILRPGGRTA